MSDRLHKHRHFSSIASNRSGTDSQTTSFQMTGLFSPEPLLAGTESLIAPIQGQGHHLNRMTIRPKLDDHQSEPLAQFEPLEQSVEPLKEQSKEQSKEPAIGGESGQGFSFRHISVQPPVLLASTHDRSSSFIQRQAIAEEPDRQWQAKPPTEFPHADQIQRGLNITTPLHSIIDPQGCAERHTPAYTDGQITHFANDTPSLHVAAHEAAHQLQHQGLTRDAGLGPEGHAGAVADALSQGQSAASLIGQSGAPVASASRNYVFTNKAGQWQNLDPGAALGKLSETGETLTFHTHEAFATPTLIASANTVLKAKQSGIEIADGGAGVQVVAPDGSGSKALSKLDVKQVGNPGSKEFYGDCGRLAREVMGPTGQDAPASIVCKPGGTPRVIDPVISKKAAKEQMALMLFLDRRIRTTPNYEKLTDDEKKKIADTAQKEYNALSETEKEDFIKKELKEGRIPRDKAEELGIDEYAQPAIGEAYTIVRAGPADPGGYPYHWAAVIMIAGENRVTFENAAESGNYDGKNTKWYIDTFGPASKKQTFHDDWKSGFGENAHTLTARTQPPPPDYVDKLPSMATAELLQKYTVGNESDKFYLEAELRQRHVYVDINVDATEDYKNDEVYVAFTGGGRKFETKSQAMSRGSGHIFTVPIANLLPFADPWQVNVYEWDLIGDDLIGSINWPSPYFQKTNVPLSYRSARYRVTLTL